MSEVRDKAVIRSTDNFGRLLMFAVLLALVVIVLGAYTRLSDAGLGCPDWPGCYGQLSVPEKINEKLFERPLESGKAWKEMIHRYVAGTLGLVILLILILAVKNRHNLRQPLYLPIVLLGVVIFQALLGMWTVTMLLSPVIVTAHLLGGLTTLSTLWWLLLNRGVVNQYVSTHASLITDVFALKFWAGLGLLLVFLQIFLGGWTSSNYAALACGTDFPTCSGQWWPKMDFDAGFTFLHESGKNYEFGVLDSPARTAIQKMHRIGALVVSIYMLVLSFNLLKHSFSKLKTLGIILLVVLVTQVSLGILNVVMALPLGIAVLHNVVAAMLLLTLITINHCLHRVSGHRVKG